MFEIGEYAIQIEEALVTKEKSTQDDDAERVRHEKK